MELRGTTTTESPSRISMLRGTILRDVGLPVATYYLLKWAGLNDLLALTAGGLVSGGIAVAGVIRSRRTDPVAVFVLGLFVLGLVTALITGDPRLVLAKDSLTTTVAGLAFLVTTWVGTPLLYHFAIRSAGDTPRGREIAEKYATMPEVRGRFRALSRLWGAGLIAEAMIRLVLVYTLPINVMVVVSPVLMIGTMALLFSVTLRRMKPGEPVAQLSR